MLNARLKPDAKKPPKGATRDAKVARTTACSWNGAHGIDVTDRRSCHVQRRVSEGDGEIEEELGEKGK